MDVDAYYELKDVLPLASSKAKELADISGKIDAILSGSEICRERVEAQLVRNYLQMCPIAVYSEVISLPGGDALVVDMYYDANATHKMLGS